MRENLLTSGTFVRSLKATSSQYRGVEANRRHTLSTLPGACKALVDELNLELSKNKAVAALLTRMKKVSNRVFIGFDTFTRYNSTSYCTAPFLFSLDTSPAVTCLATGVWTPLLPAPHPHNVRYEAGVRYRQISAGHNSPYSVGGSATISGTGYFSFKKLSNESERKIRLSGVENNHQIIDSSLERK